MSNQPKHRRLRCAIAIALSVLIAGYWLFAGAFQYWQLSQVKAEIHQLLKTNVPDSLIVTFSIEDLHKPGVRFEHSREFAMESYKYDIVDTITASGRIAVRCVRDDKEKMVEAQLLSLYGHASKAQKKSGQKGPELLKCFFSQQTILIHATNTAQAYGAVCLVGDYSYAHYQESPPPEEAVGFLILS